MVGHLSCLKLHNRDLHGLRIVSDSVATDTTNTTVTATTTTTTTAAAATTTTTTTATTATTPTTTTTTTTTIAAAAVPTVRFFYRCPNTAAVTGCSDRFRLFCAEELPCSVRR